ncbi:MATE family efflux transporter [Burkholderia sp. Leaf177]|uniref:MATE family efflux transporter n=1 Tax=Burkholderia sp. Leaf177 TaxID=1736287 RepID=UPI0009E6737F|nr:MATE family efflux transporter [Burkholderia sp. Leaf177]
MTSIRQAAIARSSARFVTGSTLRHVVVMAGTGAIGLMAVFAVDLANLFYVSLLGDTSIAAAVGFAGTINFFITAISIGMTIGVSATVARLLGAGQRMKARQVASASLVLMVAVTIVLSAATLLFLDPILSALGAAGETRTLARSFLMITAPTYVFFAIGMCTAALMRSIGDARRAMAVTLVAAVVTAVLDPILIFGFHLGLTGAAISNDIARLALAAVGLHGAMRVNDLIGPVRFSRLWTHSRPVMKVALPAVLTNLATPVASAYVTHAMARFGAAAVAGQATVDRIAPVAFALIFALTGAVGPIIAQNLGAGRADRIRETIRNSLVFVLLTVAVAWLVLALVQNGLIRAFSARGDTAMIIRVFCSWLVASYAFVGCLFVANATFNNLDRPLLSTLFNWGRATLGTLPFVAVGIKYGPIGVMIGIAASNAVFGTMAMLVAFIVVKRLPMGDCAAMARKDSNRLEQSSVNVPGAAVGNTVAPDVELKALPAQGR